MTDIVIAAAIRSPIGIFQGSLSSLSAVEIGTQVMQALIKKPALQRRLLTRSYSVMC